MEKFITKEMNLAIISNNGTECTGTLAVVLEKAFNMLKKAEKVINGYVDAAKFLKNIANNGIFNYTSMIQSYERDIMNILNTYTPRTITYNRTYQWVPLRKRYHDVSAETYDRVLSTYKYTSEYNMHIDKEIPKKNIESLIDIVAYANTLKYVYSENIRYNHDDDYYDSDTIILKSHDDNIYNYVYKKCALLDIY